MKRLLDELYVVNSYIFTIYCEEYIYIYKIIIVMLQLVAVMQRSVA